MRHIKIFDIVPDLFKLFEKVMGVFCIDLECMNSPSAVCEVLLLSPAELTLYIIKAPLVTVRAPLCDRFIRLSVCPFCLLPECIQKKNNFLKN